ncbi:MAG: hypothetical protein WD055_02835 [Candidatus Dependentiae bacterium]
MKQLYLKKYVLTIVMLSLLVQPAIGHAGWSDWFKNWSFNEVKEVVLPYLKDPKVYAIAALASVGLYAFIRQRSSGNIQANSDVSQASSHDNRQVKETPKIKYSDVSTYVRNILFQSISNSKDIDFLICKVKTMLNEQDESEIDQAVLDGIILYCRMNYEFYRKADSAFRSPDNLIQDRSSLVKRQGGSTCAMHAAFNGVTLYQNYTNSADYRDANVFDLLKKGPEINSCKEYLRLNVDPDHYDARYENLNEFAINNVMETLLQMNVENYTIIPNVMEFGPELDEHFPLVAQRLQSEENYCHVFLLGNMSNYETGSGTLRGRQGHWISVVARSGEHGIELFVMDSLNVRNTQGPLVHKLQLFLVIPHQELQLIADVENDFKTAQIRCYEDGLVVYETALEKIETIVTVAKDKNLIHSWTFQTKYAGHIKRMLNRINTYANNELGVRIAQVLSLLD